MLFTACKGSLPVGDCLILELVYHTVIERLRLEGTSGGHLVQTPRSSRAVHSWLLRIMSRWLLNIPRDGDSTTSLGNL